MTADQEAVSEEHMGVLRRAFANGNSTVHVDGWTSQRGRDALAEAERRGWVMSFVGGDSQYTAINYTITELGRESTNA